LEGSGWPNRGTVPVFAQKGVRKATKTLSQDGPATLNSSSSPIGVKSVIAALTRTSMMMMMMIIVIVVVVVVVVVVIIIIIIIIIIIREFYVHTKGK
jgi:uncharacterized membrane protein